MRIGDRIIGKEYPPYVIAELSGNHNGDINRAKRLIQIAKDAGASAVKLQTYTADSLTIPCESDQFKIKTGIWVGRTLYDLYREAHTPWDWFEELFAFADAIGIQIFSSPFDIEAVKLLEELNAPAYKIASNELVDWPLVEAVVLTGKPVIMSTGVASKQDIEDTLNFIKEIGGESIVLLHCVSAYPASAKDSNLETIKDLENSFNTLVGLSDHTLGTATSVAAVAMGACMIEKHYTLDRNDGGPDASFSLEPNELAVLCEDTLSAWESARGIKYANETNLETKNIFTRQFWSVENINEGAKLTTKNIKSIRAPIGSGGISTRNFRDVYGKNVIKKIGKYQPICWSDIA